MNELDGLFAPERVAVIGATDAEGSIGRSLFDNVLDGYAGEVVPVNPNRDKVRGLECYGSVTDVPDPIDLAIVAVPAEAVLDVVNEIGEAGIANVVVITAGFGETDAGEEREKALRSIAIDHDLNLVGPNCLGIISTPVGLNATFAANDADPGPISFFSQSGGFITAVLDWAASHDLGFHHVVSLGNEAVLDEVDFISAWGSHGHCEVVLGHVEDIVHGQDFLEIAREVTRDTPVVLVKGGRTEAGAAAAASHTGSLAGSDRAFDAAMRQGGVIRADTVEELFDYGRVLAGQPLPDNDQVVVLTNSGGPGVMAADAVGDTALSLADLDESTRSRLAEELPDTASLGNPIDLVGDAPVDRFEAALDVLVDDPAIGSLLVLACPSGALDYRALAEAIADRATRDETATVACLMGGEMADQAAERLDEARVPNFFDPDRAIRSLSTLQRVREVQERPRQTPTTFDVDTARVDSIINEARAAGRTQLGSESMAILDACGIPTPPGEVVTSGEEAEQVARDIGGAIALKVVSPDVIHKSDVGGVAIDVSTETVGERYQELVDRVESAQPEADIHGVQVQAMIDTSDGTETIVGASRDPNFGPMVMFGLGGVFVEVLEDTAFRIAPVTENEARQMTEDIQSAPMLRGARGREPADIDQLVEVIQRVSQLVTDRPEIRELDLNPVVAAPDGVCAIDFRMTVDPIDDGE
jgi:acetyl coenzyme A synthetase (ADP forming)-like protein